MQRWREDVLKMILRNVNTTGKNKWLDAFY